ncbi:helix-turn-helix domain-containing protein [Bacillus infantis]|uniref:helix-turn-helix domain-containing protein n=1 Tax=Bacillus infantis TaxID=324767 RepID=UPI003CE8E4FB
MIDIKVNEEELKALYQEEIRKSIEKIQFESMLMDSKQLCKMLSLSWPTVEKEFLKDPNFPKIRLGAKWLFHRGEVQRYIDQWSIEIRKKGVQA